MNSKRTALIIGAGPAGLTAAYELVTKTDIKPIIIEKSKYTGGICKTINYKGNRIDIGGHRFYTDSNRIMDWWTNILPLQGFPASDDIVLNRKLDFSKKPEAADPEKTDKVFLIRNRISRIYFLNNFFDYPISLNLKTITGLGICRIIKIIISYIKYKLFPIKEVKTLEDFFINRFGKELYNTFFKDYSEKVWGVPCDKINPEWGSDRIDKMSMSEAIIDAFKKILVKKNNLSSQKSLTKIFYYPKLGPGQLWKETEKIITEKGGKVLKESEVIGIEYSNNNITGLKIKNLTDNSINLIKADYYLSSMPVDELINCMGNDIPDEVKTISSGLVFRDFITVGMLFSRLKIKNKSNIKTINDIIPDSWIYVQDNNVKLARIQIYNNWSPYMIQDTSKVWLGLEYFCNKNDRLWNMENSKIAEIASEELYRMNLADKEDLEDYIIIKMPKAYPVYTGTYNNFNIIRNFTDRFDNLFLIGRNGMHKYNNIDKSMMSAIIAAENIIKGIKSKDNIWNNTYE